MHPYLLRKDSITTNKCILDVYAIVWPSGDENSMPNLRAPTWINFQYFQFWSWETLILTSENVLNYNIIWRKRPIKTDVLGFTKSFQYYYQMMTSMVAMQYLASIPGCPEMSIFISHLVNGRLDTFMYAYGLLHHEHFDLESSNKPLTCVFYDLAISYRPAPVPAKRRPHPMYVRVGLSISINKVFSAAQVLSRVGIFLETIGEKLNEVGHRWEELGTLFNRRRSNWSICWCVTIEQPYNQYFVSFNSIFHPQIYNSRIQNNTFS